MSEPIFPNDCCPTREACCCKDDLSADEARRCLSLAKELASKKAGQRGWPSLDEEVNLGWVFEIDRTLIVRALRNYAAPPAQIATLRQQLAEAREKAIDECAGCIPSTWLDPLLSGPNKVAEFPKLPRCRKAAERYPRPHQRSQGARVVTEPRRSRSMNEIIAHLRMCIADGSITTTLIQIEDLAALCDAAERATVPLSELEAWIEAEFFGCAVAVRQIDDPPIPGEPFMSISEAKRLTRLAIARFSLNADESGGE